MIQSILVESDFNKKVADYCKKRKSIDEKTVRLIKYKVNTVKNDLILEEVEV